MTTYVPRYTPPFSNPFLMFNPITLTDYYNGSHERLKVNTDWEVSHIYNRRAYRGKGMVVFGLHEIVTDLLSIKITPEMVEDAKYYYELLGAEFPYALWMRVVFECNGYLPLEVEMLPEGSYAPVGTPFAQIRNTVKGFGEMVTWFEGCFLHMWGEAAPATEALHVRNYLESLVPKYGTVALAKAHSFGFRGHSSILTALKTAKGWNLFLIGTDDLIGVPFCNGAKLGSIPASAHKVTQQFDDELTGAFHAIDAVAGKEDVVAMPIDTFDAWYFIKHYVKPILNYAKEKGVHVVFRPDSGSSFEDLFDQVIAIYEVVKSEGFRNGTCIVGEAMSFDNMVRGDKYLEAHGVPAIFCFNGIGGKFYNQFTRDTHGLAMKTAFSNGTDRMKLVKSDPSKQSIPGFVLLNYDENGDMVVYPDDIPRSGEVGLYKTIYSYSHEWGDPKPQINAPNWNETFKRAQELIGKPLQDKIKLSAELVAKIQGFHDKYSH